MWIGEFIQEKFSGETENAKVHVSCIKGQRNVLQIEQITSISLKSIKIVAKRTGEILNDNVMTYFLKITKQRER